MTIKDHVVNAVAAAAAIGLGTLTLNNNVELGRHDERIKRVEQLDQNIVKLSDKLDTTRLQLERLDARLGADEGRNG